MFLKLLRRLNAFLRNTSLREDHQLITVDDDYMDRLFDDSKDPWYTRVYWVIYRFFRNTIIFHPTEMYSEVKWFIQRGKRGWADRDVWSLDYYLNGWMPEALRHLKKTKHGTPMSMFPSEPEYIKPCGNPTDAAHEIAIARWDATMDKMIAAFEASRRMDEGLYEDELGAYPLRRPKGVSKEDWKKVGDDRYKASRLLEERDQKIFEEGMKLFVEHYRSLWD
jgi:hypothetical protein